MHPWTAARGVGQLKRGEGCGTRLRENRWRGAADVEVCWVRGQLGGAGPSLARVRWELGGCT